MPEPARTITPLQTNPAGSPPVIYKNAPNVGDSYRPVEDPYGTPTSTNVFTPVTSKNKVPGDINRGPFPNSPALDPYGQALGNTSYGMTNIFGGPADLVKSVATRSLAIDYLKNRYAQPAMPEGLAQSLQGYGASNPYLESMISAYLPTLEGQATQVFDKNRMQLNDLTMGAYALGGGIYGGQLAAYAASKQQDKAREAARTKETQAIVGGLMRGLGLNQYGEADTTEGAIGVFEL